MAYTKKKLEELDIIDNFLMDRLAFDETFGEDFCRRMLSSLLQREITGRLQVHAQKFLPAHTPTMRGIRMDVEIEETGDAREGAKPAILNYDPFGQDYMMYTIRNHCEEIPELEYEDGLRFYYFYTGGKKGGNDQLRTLLRYIQDSRRENATDEATLALHQHVSRAKVSPEVKEAYMTFEEFIYYERKDATAASKKEDILSILADYGEIPESIRNYIEETDDPDTLSHWVKLAARVNSPEEFMERLASKTDQNA